MDHIALRNQLEYSIESGKFVLTPIDKPMLPTTQPPMVERSNLERIVALIKETTSSGPSPPKEGEAALTRAELVQKLATEPAVYPVSISNYLRSNPAPTTTDIAVIYASGPIQCPYIITFLHLLFPLSQSSFFSQPPTGFRTAGTSPLLIPRWPRVRTDFPLRLQPLVLFAKYRNQIISSSGFFWSFSLSTHPTPDFDKVRRMSSVKAVVLHVNSPGGQADASEAIWSEVRKTQAAGKKVIVSMGDYAASGGSVETFMDHSLVLIYPILPIFQVLYRRSGRCHYGSARHRDWVDWYLLRKVPYS